MCAYDCNRKDKILYHMIFCLDGGGMFALLLVAGVEDRVRGRGGMVVKTEEVRLRGNRQIGR